MIQPGIRLVFVIFSLTCFSFLPQAQTTDTSVTVNKNENNNKPYRILTAGRQVTIKSTKNIRNVMVWTSGGHRIIEEKDVNTSNYSFRITINEKIFFVRVQLADGNSYSEKIGVL